MALECNIDAKGKAARLMGGIAGVTGGVFVLAGIAVGLLSGAIWLLPAGGALAGGGFAIFEARAGWCVVRAMGIRTPL